MSECKSQAQLQVGRYMRSVTCIGNVLPIALGNCIPSVRIWPSWHEGKVGKKNQGASGCSWLLDTHSGLCSKSPVPADTDKCIFPRWRWILAHGAKNIPPALLHSAFGGQAAVTSTSLTSVREDRKQRCLCGHAAKEEYGHKGLTFQNS